MARCTVTNHGVPAAYRHDASACVNCQAQADIAGFRKESVEREGRGAGGGGTGECLMCICVSVWMRTYRRRDAVHMQVVDRVKRRLVKSKHPLPVSHRPLV